MVDLLFLPLDETSVNALTVTVTLFPGYKIIQMDHYFWAITANETGSNTGSGIKPWTYRHIERT